MAKPVLTIVIPTLNEEAGIGHSITVIPRSELSRTYDLEVLIVDSQSKDRTAEIARSLGARVITEPRRGYGRAYKTGFDEAKGGILVSLDGDATYPASDIPSLVEIIRKGDADFITTNRFASMARGSMTPMNRIGNLVLTLFAGALFLMPIQDSQSGMWVLTKASWTRLRGKVKGDGMDFSQEIKIEAWRSGLKCREMPIHYAARAGKAKLNPLRDGIRNLLCLFKKRIRA
ncbi:MAG: glycosyltransferase family 2 protein [Candidatus Micrarchaeia archaeon]